MRWIVLVAERSVYDALDDYVHGVEAAAEAANVRDSGGVKVSAPGARVAESWCGRVSLKEDRWRGDQPRALLEPVFPHRGLSVGRSAR